MSEHDDSDSIKGLGFEGAPAPQKKGQPNWLLIILVVSAALILCCCIVIGALIFGTIAAGGALFGELMSGPYDIAGRPAPVSISPYDLLPPSVAGFTRASLGGNESGGWDAVYTRSGVTIEAQVRIYDSLGAAQSAVEAAGREFDSASGVATRMTGSLNDLWYRLVKRSSEAHFAYNRGQYFFYARTSDGVGAFDDFMDGFPY
ncbi:MAG: hypothetical protein JXB47_08315 [Anaerolineae bacterium]|nr:hypothetical protein [Anaerolineae bacterium]